METEPRVHWRVGLHLNVQNNWLQIESGQCMVSITFTCTGTLSTPAVPSQQEFCTVNRTWPDSSLTVASATQWTTIGNNIVRITLHLQQLTKPAARQWSPSLTTGMVWCQVEQDATLISEHILYLKPEYLLMGRLAENLNVATESVVPKSVL